MVVLRRTIIKVCGYLGFEKSFEPGAIVVAMKGSDESSLSEKQMQTTNHSEGNTYHSNPRLLICIHMFTYHIFYLE